MRYQVIVGNIGTVVDTDNMIEAKRIYGNFKRHSIEGYGRASAEPVTIFRDGEPLQGFDYVPPAPKEEDDDIGNQDE